MLTADNIALRADTVVLAKMYFYHLVTKSQTVHNLFWGYIFELYVNHYEKSIEIANLALDRMHRTEKWFLQYYYDFYEERTGDFVPVMEHYCDIVKSNKTTENNSVLSCTGQELHENAARLLMDMHLSFLAEVK